MALSGVISGLGVYVSDVWATPCSHVGQLKTCLAVDPSGLAFRPCFRRWDARMRSITQASKEKQQTKGGEASNACLQASKLLVANTLVLASLLACRPSWRVAVGGLVEVMRTFICALLDVSPRVRRLCVLPGWQRNVNVNERRTFRWDDLSNPKIPEKETD